MKKRSKPKSKSSEDKESESTEAEDISPNNEKIDTKSKPKNHVGSTSKNRERNKKRNSEPNSDNDKAPKQ